MSEKISDLIQKIEKDSSSTQEQKEKARKVLELLNARNKWSLIVSAGSRQAILWLLTETTLDANISAEAIWDNLSQGWLSPWASGNLDLWSQDATDDWSWEMENWDDEIDMEAENFAEQLSRQWWDDVYVIAKMISLGYMPTLHSMSHTKTSYNPIKWVWANKWYFIAGGFLTNWKINWKSAQLQKKLVDGCLSFFNWPKEEIKILLNSIKANDTSWDRTKLEQRSDCLERLEEAIKKWSVADIKSISKEYSDISEKTWKISDLYKKHNLKRTVKTERDRLWQVAYEAEEKKIKADRKAIIDEIDRLVAENDKNKQNSVDTEDWVRNKNTQDLDILVDQRTKLEDDLRKAEKHRKTLLEQKSKYDKDQRQIVDDLNRELSKKGWWDPVKIKNYEDEKIRLAWEINKIDKRIDSKDSQITRIEDSISTKQIDITKQERIIRDYKPSNTAEIAEYDYKKWFLEDLKSSVDVWDHKKTADLLKQFKRKTWSDFKFDTSKLILPSSVAKPVVPWSPPPPPPGPNDPDKFIVTDQKEVLDKARKSWRWTSKDLSDSLDREATKITKVEREQAKAEIERIEKEIDRLKKEADKKLNDLNKIASKNPDKVKDLRAEAEKLVWDYNIQVAALEKAWVENLRKLDLDDIKLLSVKSKWTNRIIEWNGWIDKHGLNWPIWKVLWIAAIALFAKWWYDAIGETWLFTKETFNNVADIWIWLIPVVWWLYDIWMAFKWSDLNGVEMSTSERWTRAWLWVVWLIPMVWSIVKWSATTAKVAKTTERALNVSRIWETIVHWWQLTWKVASIWYLFAGWWSTVTYALDKYNS